jgi:phosphonate transport system substrate-binding protein
MYFFRFVISALLLLALSFSVLADDHKTLKFGILPFESAHTLFTRFTPLKDYLSRHTGYKIALETAPDFASHVTNIREGKYDIVYTAPHFVPAALDSKHYQLLVALSNPLYGQFVARTNSPINNLKQLDNKTVATPSARAIVTKIGMYHLEKNIGINPSAYHVYRTHNAAFRAVLEGHADGAVISVNIYNKAISDGFELRAIGQTQAIPSSAILGNVELSKALQEKIQQLLAGIGESDEGKKVLKQIKYQGFEVIPASKYDSMRKYLD